VNIETTNRPLYRYVPTPAPFACPADKGDELYNCFKEYGNSYLPQFQHDSFLVRHVVGDLKVPANTYEWRPIKSSEIALSAANKILQGDWRKGGQEDDLGVGRGPEPLDHLLQVRFELRNRNAAGVVVVHAESDQHHGFASLVSGSCYRTRGTTGQKAHQANTQDSAQE
jgi:hypothetical protein